MGHIPVPYFKVEPKMEYEKIHRMFDRAVKEGGAQAFCISPTAYSCIYPTVFKKPVSRSVKFLEKLSHFLPFLRRVGSEPLPFEPETRYSKIKEDKLILYFKGRPIYVLPIMEDWLDKYKVKYLGKDF